VTKIPKTKDKSMGFNEFNFNYFSGGERRIANGNIAKQGIHKQCGISLETPKLHSQNLNETIKVIFICTLLLNMNYLVSYVEIH
jgi:hypothetical protein